MTGGPVESAAPLVEMRGITKAFGGVRALEDVSLDLGRGEVVGLLGHNGAGKSTLIKILSGLHAADAGEIRIGGEPVAIETPHDAKRLGIETIYQDLALAENLDAVANVFLGRERFSRFGLLDEEGMEHETRALMDRMQLRLPSLRLSVSQLSGGQRQAIAIGRAVYFDARILIMDEPTAALGPAETAKVAELVDTLKRQGIGILLISHDIHDVFDLSDRVTVLLHGRNVGTCRTADVTTDEILGMIISGRLPDGYAGPAPPMERRAVSETVE
ncbi:MAG: ATP-binding cassette domain-containing protein [Azospirillaceae bacterium]